MTFVSRLIGTTAAALGAVALLGGPSAVAATYPGGIVAGSGCSVACIETATVKSEAATATLTVTTSVDARITLYVTKVVATGQQPKHLPSQAYKRQHGFFIWQLEPATKYAIAVTATDRQGKSSTRQGSFETPPVQTTGAGAGPGGIASNVGCSVQCITHALFTQKPPVASAAYVEIRTTTAAKIRVLVYSDDTYIDLVAEQASTGFATEWTTSVGRLAPGTKYYAEVQATDAAGHTSVRQGSFRTVKRIAVVTFAKIKVISDADKGSAAGEVHFEFGAGGAMRSDGGWRKVDSGDVITVRGPGTSRPGLSFTASANGSEKLRLSAVGTECDGVALMKNCLIEAGGSNIDTGQGTGGSGGDGTDNDYAWTRGVFDVDALLGGDALPPGYGIPGGHDAYVTFETTAHHLKFRVYAYVDVHYEWPA
jgi:hypothetical protein